MSETKGFPTGTPGVWTDEERAVVKTSWLPLRYGWIYGDLVKVARRCGYALALHGSMTRDLDVVAVPWTNEATSAEELVEALTHELGAGHTVVGPTAKPHGRLAWSLVFGGPYIDLSVAPRENEQYRIVDTKLDL